MNTNKNKSIRKGFIFSKTIFPAVGAFLLATQMTGCSGMTDRLYNKKNDSKSESDGSTRNWKKILTINKGKRRKKKKPNNTPEKPKESKNNEWDGLEEDDNGLALSS